MLRIGPRELMEVCPPLPSASHTSSHHSCGFAASLSKHRRLWLTTRLEKFSKQLPDPGVPFSAAGHRCCVSAGHGPVS